MAIFIPDLFTGYINGREKAITSNWNDISNYNKTIDEQLKNAYNMETFDARVRNAWNGAAQSDMNTAVNAIDADNMIRQQQGFAQAGGNQLQTNARIAQLQDLIARAQAEIQQLSNQAANPQSTAAGGNPAATNPPGFNPGSLSQSGK